MHSWLRVRKRFECAIALFAIVSFLGAGFLLTGSAPSEIRWIVWILVGTLVFPICLAGLFIGRWVRRRGSGASATTGPPRLASRLGIYILMFLLAAVVALQLAKAALEHHWPLESIGRIFLWDLAILAVLIALSELSIRRKTKRLSRDQ